MPKLPTKRSSVAEGLCYINEPKESVDFYAPAGANHGGNVKSDYFRLVCKELGYVYNLSKVASARLVLEANGIHWDPTKHESTSSTVTALTLSIITDILRERDNQH